MNALLELFGVDSLGELFVTMLSDVLTVIIESFFTMFDELLIDLLGGSLRAETLVVVNGATYLSEGSISNMFTFIYGFCRALIVLKFLHKGFKVYILWRNGDADSSPADMLIGMAQAAVVMVAFPVLYEYMVDITIYFAEHLLQLMGSYEYVSNPFVALIQIIAGSGLLYLLILLIYLIIVFFLWLQLLARGFELLILRLGVPFACLGLIDSDTGIFNGYMQIFFKAMMTSVIQIALLSLSIKVMTGLGFMNIIVGIVMLMAAFKTPNLLQQILVQNNGSGVINKTQSVAMLANSIKGLIK